MEKRSLPHSIEAEQGVLGSMLISPRDVIGECVEKINEEYFHAPRHQTIYLLLVELWRAGEAIDLITFTQVLRDRKKLEQVGGASWVTSLFTFVPTAANITYYLEIVRDKYICRQIIASCTEAAHRAFEEQDDVNSLLDQFERTALSIRPEQNRPVISIKEATMEAIEVIEHAYGNRGTGGVTGLATGFHEFDRMTSGLQDGDFIVIAGRPSMGKTALAMNIAEHVAVVERKPVQVFSIEMTLKQIVQRMLCSRARVNLQKVRDGFLAERDFPSLTAAAAKICESKLHIDDVEITIDALRARCRRAKQQHGIVLAVVDYLQLLSASGFKPGERQAEVTFISKGLKSIAKELRIPLIVLAQLNRNPERREGGKPRLSDLRESGSIEQDADLVGLLHRPEVYEDDEDRKCELAGEAELIIAKQRSGPIGEIPLTFLKEFTRFEDRARNISEEY